jgi:hypothetical protein
MCLYVFYLVAQRAIYTATQSSKAYYGGHATPHRGASVGAVYLLSKLDLHGASSRNCLSWHEKMRWREKKKNAHRGFVCMPLAPTKEKEHEVHSPRRFWRGYRGPSLTPGCGVALACIIVYVVYPKQNLKGVKLLLCSSLCEDIPNISPVGW